MAEKDNEKLFEEKLGVLKASLEGKAKEHVDTAVKEFQKAFEKDYAEKTKTLVGEELKEYQSKADQTENGLKELKTYAEKLDAKINEKATQTGEKEGFESKMAKLIKDNFEGISNVSKGRGFKLGQKETKAVGNMTTANLTGDEEREYSREVAMVPGRLVHFVDLCGPDINIGVGTYTFPRETTSEGAIATQTEGSDKGQIDYDLSNIDVATDFLAGFAVYSKKMRNNLPFLESFLPRALRRDYMNAEDTSFNTTLAAAATASAQIITGKNKVEMLINELATLAGINFVGNTIVSRPADYFNILITEKSTGAGYGLPGIVTFDNGVLRINGVAYVWANWLAANKYYVGDWSTINRVVTEGLSLEFSEHDEDNFRKNNITARIEAQIGLAIHRTDAVILGDFTAT